MTKILANTKENICCNVSKFAKFQQIYPKFGDYFYVKKPVLKNPVPSSADLAAEQIFSDLIRNTTLEGKIQLNQNAT
jgi:hypothetical protein